MVDVTTAEDVQRKQLSPHNSNNEWYCRFVDAKV
jgi:hypothetical protein